MASIWDALTAIGAKDTAYRNNQHMNKVFAANPDFAQALYGAQNEQTKLGLLEDQQRREIARQNALKQLAGQAQGLSAADLIGQVAATTGSDDALLALAKLKRSQETGLNPDLPSAVQEYQYYSGLTPEQQKQYLGVKRAQQILDLGGGFGAVNLDRSVTPVANKTLAPEQLPSTKAAQAEASASGSEIGKEKGAASAKLNAMEAALPGLYEVTDKLSKLGKIATYTTAGQVRDAAARELNMDIPDAAVARTEFMTTIDNEVLPLLRDTFGSAFTVEEGNRLRSTLGNENLSPPEKDAALRSFIDAKTREIKKLQRQTGQSSQPLKVTVKPTPEQAREILRQRGIVQ